MPEEPKDLRPFGAWREHADLHRTRAEAWTLPYRRRRACGEMHPVFDFLFIYYRFPPSQLEAWHPACGIALEADALPADRNPAFYSFRKGSFYLDASKIDEKACRRLAWTRDLCRATQRRPAQFGCFGMHEWAMVYQGGPQGRPRHEGTLPLRLPQAEIDTVVQSRPICCSHFDAFRFFTAAAMPLNKIQPTQAARMDNEQSGCLHTNMDVYKWAAKCMPWVGSDLLWDAFELAVRCREVDMRASPYDCTALGYEPIQIESEAGRAEYECEQRRLAEAARPLRARLIRALERCLENSE